MSSKREKAAFEAAMLQRADALIRRELGEVSVPRAEDRTPTTSKAIPEEPPAKTAASPGLPQAA
jgi:hypothetical protein